jgi:hypothetical protein
MNAKRMIQDSHPIGARKSPLRGLRDIRTSPKSYSTEHSLPLSGCRQKCFPSTSPCDWKNFTFRSAISRCKAVILCCSPVGSGFRSEVLEGYAVCRRHDRVLLYLPRLTLIAKTNLAWVAATSIRRLRLLFLVPFTPRSHLFAISADLISGYGRFFCCGGWRADRAQSGVLGLASVHQLLS